MKILCCCFGRSNRQEAEVKQTIDVNVKSFEDVSTLPSCWSPPKQYNELSITKDGQDHHDKDSGYSSSAVLATPSEDYRRDPSPSNVDNNRIDGTAYINENTCRESQSLGIERKHNYNDAHDNRQIAGVFKKGIDHFGPAEDRQSSISVSKHETDHRNKVTEDENALRQNVILRHRDDLPLDRELRLKEWEKRLSQRDTQVHTYPEGKNEINETEISSSSSSSSVARLERSQLHDSHHERRSMERKERRKLEEEKECRRVDVEKSTKEDVRKIEDVEKSSKDVRKIEENSLQQRSCNDEERERRKRKLQMEKERLIKEEERNRLRREERRERLRNEDEHKEIERKEERERSWREKQEKEMLRGKEEVLRHEQEEQERLRKDEKNLKLERERERSRREQERKRLEREQEERLKREEHVKERLRKETEEREKLMREVEVQELRRKEEEKRDSLRREEKERELRKVAEEKERLRKEAEKIEQMRRETEERERIKEEEERERCRKEEEGRERLRKEEEERKKLKKEKEEKETLRRDEKEREKLRREEEERLKREEEELERLMREKEEKETLRREKEEKETMRRENEERERLRRQEEEKRERIRREEVERVRIEEEEREILRRETVEKERLRREEERERMSREKEERERLRIEEEERERVRREEEEIERVRREEEEIERMRREEEEIERVRREEEEERERVSKEDEERERVRREEEKERLRREEEEREMLRREEEEREMLRREEKEREMLRREEEEREMLRREEEEREMLRREEEEREMLRREEEEREMLRREEEEREMLRREEEEREMLRREEEEREMLRREEEERVMLRREEEKKERLRREEEERKRLKRKEEKERERLRREEEERERLKREEEERERLRREEEEREGLRTEKEERERLMKEEEERERLRREQEKRERLRKEQEERERFRIEQEERERLRREEERERLKRNQEEKERIRKEQEERERLIREQETREKLKREEEEREALRKEKQERMRLRKEEERERVKIEVEERDRLRREEWKRESLRREEEEREKVRRIEEMENLRKEKEKRERLRGEEEREWIRRKEEERKRLRKESGEKERMRRDAEEREKLKQEVERGLLKKEEERNERLRNEELHREKLKEKEEGFRKEENIRLREAREIEKLRKDGAETTKIVNQIEERNSQIERNLKEELERKWHAKREKLEEEERIRKEKDRVEIEKTKRRIAELKKERDEIQRQQAMRLRMLITEETEEGKSDAETWSEITPASEDEIVEVNYPKRSLPFHVEKESEIHLTKDEGSPTTSESLDQKEVCQTDGSSRISEERTECTELDHETNSRKVEDAFSAQQTEERLSEDNTTEGFEENFNDVAYDHTVLSAQHKLQFCTSSYNDSKSKEPEAKNDASHTEHFSSSTLSSEFEPLPPPVPPHNVDPATLASTAAVCIDQQRLPPLPSDSELPEPMTPEEAEKLLSHNIIETKKALLADAGEFSKGPSVQRAFPPENEIVPQVIDDANTPKSEQDDAFDKDYDSVCVDSPTSDNEEEPYGYFKHEVNEEGFVVRAKEILNEDGVHYLEDGHFWIQVPGLTEDDDDELPESVPIHKHTKLKFSKDPIKLFSTFSVTDYDRRNDDVDPVAASAEYELEKRVEKMNVFPVCIEKGEGGLGLSIIGMGVGADAGVEKLGIFVKTITPGGATANDGRIQVNDQIIEVDNQSLVGVTQMFAASVLKNTSGTVNFLIGRENDPENSEVAMLIRQSLMADHERDERRRALEGPNYDPRNSSGIFESFSSQSGGESPSEEAPRNNYVRRNGPQDHNLYGQDFGDQYGDPYGSCPSSPPEGVASPPPEAFNHDVEGRELLLQNNEIIIMSQHLQEIQHRNEMYEEEITILRNKICELEKELGTTTDMTKKIQETTAKLKEAEDTLQARHVEIATYQDMLEQSQGQYIILEKKYYKAKKIIKEYQSRERDFLHREEYHITQLEEKDALYNSLVKALKDRVIQLEGDLIKAQQEAGLPVKVPPDLNAQSSNFVKSKGQDNQTSIQKDPPRKPSTLNNLDADLSDTEGGDTHTSEGSKSSTVERKIPSKEELDVAVPPTELLDNSFSKAKGELASRGGLANRQLPSLKKSSSNASANSFEHSFDDMVDDSLPESQQQHQLAPPSTVPSKSTSSGSFHNEESNIHSSSSTPTTSAAPSSQSSLQGNVVYGSRTQPPPPYQATHTQNTQTPAHPPSPHHQPPPYQPPPSAPLSYRPGMSSDTQSGRSDAPYRHPPPIARVQPVNRVEAVPSPLSFSNQQHQQTLAHQLKALLAEREGNPEAMQEGNKDSSCMKKSPSSLMEDVRRAVIQADMSIGKKPVISGPIHVSSTAQVVSTGQFVHSRTSPQKGSSVSSAFQQKINRDSGTWSPVISASNSGGGVVLLSQRPIDSSLPLAQTNESGDGLAAKSLVSGDSTSSFDSQSYDRLPSGRPPKEILSVFDWTKEQVAQWLVIQGLENYVSTFVSAGITGPRLINIDTKDLKNLGLSTDDKNKIKRKVKDLRQNLERERKQIEKESKEREKLQRKAEKLAEKAERRKK